MFNYEQRPNASERTDRLATAAIVTVSAAVSVGIAWASMTQLKTYGWTLFLAVPTLAGFMPVALLRLRGRRSFGRCFLVSWLTGLTALAALLLWGLEGLLCIFMAIPVMLPFQLLGTALAHFLFHRQRVRPSLGGAGAAAIVLGLATWESRNPRAADVFNTADSIVVRATEGRIWSELVGMKAIPPPRGWLLGTGMACPRTVRIARGEPGGLRVCTLSTGVLVERISIWSPGHRLRWTALATPPPLKEVNPFAHADPPHLHGFYEAIQGEFVLEWIGPSRTRLTRRTWYRHNLQPALYWRLWCDLAATQVHGVVLQEIKRLAERPVAMAPRDDPSTKSDPSGRVKS